MRICAFSDNHGNFAELTGYFGLIVNAGDFFPNEYRRFHEEEASFQQNWLEANIENLKSIIKDKPFLFCPGNHDFINPDLMEEILRHHQIEAYNLTNKLVSYGNINFYGFPYVPPINGYWNYELEYPRMVNKIDEMVNSINTQYTDVLVAHCPPYQCLDYCYNKYQNFGNTALSNALDYKINKDMLPQLLITGHVHKQMAITMRNGILVANVAETQQIIEI